METDFLDQSEYDESYFDGDIAKYRHNAGYSSYVNNPFFAKQAKFLQNEFGIRSGEQTVLDIGCAKGFLVKELQLLGISAYGLEWSDYAIKVSDVYGIMYGDATEKINGWYDFIISSRFLECLSETDLELFIINANSASKKQVHFTSANENPKFYAQRSLSDLAKFDWKKGTVLIDFKNWNKRIEI